MKRKIRLSIVLVLALAISSCDQETVSPSGNLVTVEKDFVDYHTIDVSSAYDVKVSFSDTEELIEIITDDNLAPFVVVEKSSDILKIGLEGNLNLKGNATMKVNIVTNDISTFIASGASKITLLDELETSRLTVALSGSSKMVGDLEADELIVDLSGASEANLIGRATASDFKASGASVVSSLELLIEDLKADLSGSSSIKVDVNKSIDIKASGASSLLYSGDAVIIRKELSGTSSINKR